MSSTEINWNIIYKETKKLTEEESRKKGINKTTIYPPFIAVKLREVKDKYNLINEKTILKFEDLATKFMGKTEHP